MPTKRVVPSFDALPPDAKEVADKAAVEMEKWIDEKIDSLEKEMGEELSAAVTELQQHIEVIEAELREGRERMEALLDNLASLKTDLEFGDGVDINEAIEITRSRVETVRKELADREAKWNAIGSGLVDRVTGAIRAVVPITI